MLGVHACDRRPGVHHKRADHLDLVTKPGFSYLMASIKYLRDGQYEVDRIEEDGQREATSITIFRWVPAPKLPSGMMAQPLPGSSAMS